MRIVGLDLALKKTGVTIINAGESTYGAITVEHKTLKTVYDKTTPDFQLQCQMVQLIKNEVREKDRFIVEDFGESGRGSSFSARLVPRIKLLGVMELLLRIWCKTTPILILPRKIKQFGFGKTEATKSQVKAAVLKNWRCPVHNDDEADSCVLAVMGLGLSSLSHEMTSWTHANGKIQFTPKQLKILQEFRERGLTLE